MIFTITTFAFISFNLLLTLFLFYNWNKIKEYKLTPNSHVPSTKISVIIAVRNEEETISTLLNDLINQNYPKSLLEIIIIDDHSEDKTCHIIHALNLPITLIELENELNGKKNAITEGIKKATGTLIVLTDSDCRLNKEWISTIEQFYSEVKPKMIVGGVMFHKPKNWRENILSIEFASLVGSGAALIQSNYPTMCNGANLAYEKEIFLEVNGYKDNYEIASGDDEFLMHKIAQKYPKGISFLKHKNSTVTTKAPKNWEEFFNQRKRWASKWGGYRFIYVKIIALLLFISNLSVLVSFYLSITDIRQSLLFLPILIFKISLECLFLRSVLVYFGQNLKILPFLGTTALYPFYVLSFGFIGRFGKYNWKGRYVK